MYGDNSLQDDGGADYSNAYKDRDNDRETEDICK